MCKIQKLTPEQERLLSVYRERWIDIGLCCEPANRPKAEEGFRMAYKAAGLKYPGRVIWCGSPLSAGIIVGLLRDRAWDSVRDSAWASVRDSVWASVEDSAWDSVWASVWNGVRDSVRDSVWNGVRDSVRASARDSVWGQHLAHWCGWCAYYDEVLKVPGASLGRGLIKTAQNCGWWYPYRNVVIASERTSVVRKDAVNRIHCEDGPAIAYPDGFSIYAWHGTRVPSEWIENTKNIDSSLALTWENVEQRRCLAEILGWERVLEKCNTTVVNEDIPRIGKLVRANVEDLENNTFLIMECPTGRTFAECVPNEMETARQARAWQAQQDNLNFDYEVES